MDHEPSKQSGRERRTTLRVPTKRPALFAPVNGMVKEGVVVDISGGGLQIRTRNPEPEGVTVHIEAASRPEEEFGDSIVVEARVVWVEPMGADEYAMGVRYVARNVAPMTQMQQDSSGQAASGEQRPAIKSHGTSEVPRRPFSEKDQVVFWQVKTARVVRNCAIVMVILMALVLLLLYMLFPTTVVAPAEEEVAELSSLLKPGEAPGHGGPGPARDAIDLRDPQRALPYREPPDKRRPAPTIMERASPLGPGYPVPASNSLAYRSSPSAPRNPASTSSSRVASPAVTALDAPMDAMEDTFANTYDKSLALPGVLPATNQNSETARTSGSSVYHDIETHGVDLAFSLTPVTSEALKRLPAAAIQVTVDKSAHTLTLLREGQPLRQFPVGLGRENATPTGVFQVANKLFQPTWYNGGNPVPHGDARNPLGDVWLGLGRNGRATPYGIHATKETETIGQDTSLGCVRMLPDDARTVFRLCSIGAPVLIYD